MLGISSFRQPTDDPAVRRRHWEVLLLSTLAIGLSLLLTMAPQGRVGIPGLPQLPLPTTCFSRQLLGVPCPGCGLTRSFICLAHGDWSRAWTMHRLGWLVFLATLVQIPYRLDALWRRHRGLAAGPIARTCGWLLMGLLLCNWIVGLITGRGLPPE